MNTFNTQHEERSNAPQTELAPVSERATTSETYRAPQLTVHGQLERLTLDGISSPPPVVTDPI